MGFTPSPRKKRTIECCSSLVHAASGAAILNYCCAVMLHSSIVLPPVGHSSNHEYHRCPLTGQSSGVSNFYYTFIRVSFDSPSYLSGCTLRSETENSKLFIIYTDL
jgi:hypothetical protein